MREVLIRAGQVAIRARLFDTPTADRIWSALPIYGALLTLSKFGKRFESGLYPDADGFGFPLYVGRGIGMEGGSSPRVRFWARPEVALIELVPEGS